MAATLALLALSVASDSAWAQQAYPSQPIRLVIAFGPGGVADTTSRLVAEKLSEKLGQRVVVENNPGGGGIAAARAVLSAPADGHTLALLTNGTSISVSLFKNLTFDPVTVAGTFMRGSVRAGDDALATDNVFHFVVSPVQPVRVIVVDRGGTGGGALYLNRALAIGDAPRFETVSRDQDALSDDDLRRASVVVLNDIAVPGALARRLQRFVEGGGGLFVANYYTTVSMTGVTLSSNTVQGGRGGDKGTGGYKAGDGGNGFGGGLYAESYSTVTLRNSTVSQNSAQGGAAGKGGGGNRGRGIGGGLVFDGSIDSPAVVCLDAFTVAHVKGNKASTSDPNICGSYTICS